MKKEPLYVDVAYPNGLIVDTTIDHLPRVGYVWPEDEDDDDAVVFHVKSIQTYEEQGDPDAPSHRINLE